MRKLLISAAAIVATLCAVAFLLRSNPDVTQAAQHALSSFDLMSNAKDLPVAPPPEAF